MGVDASGPSRGTVTGGKPCHSLGSLGPEKKILMRCDFQKNDTNPFFGFNKIDF
jgi:hypothetical protein